MQFDTNVTPIASNEAADQPTGTSQLRVMVFALFFIFGGITSLNDVLIPKLKGLFTLTYAEALLVQSAFFGAYLLISIPAAAIVGRVGYIRAAAIGLLTMMAGCLLFIPASMSATFGVFLVALFILAAGITIVQVVANPLISLLGPPATAHSRLTFAQAFNSLGTTIFPFVGSLLILGSYHQAGASQSDLTGETRIVAHTYLGLAIALAILATTVWLYRNRLPVTRTRGPGILSELGLLARPRFAFGVLCIFLYVGAEVAIGSLIVSYLMQPGTLGLAEQAAGTHVPFYWGGAMIGRFVGAGLLRLVSPGKVLTGAAGTAITLLVISATTAGTVSGWSLLAIGLANSIMFPTIFSLACEGLGERAAGGSGIICMAIVGGAIIPPMTGHVADLAGLRLALLVPLTCYVVIASFGWYARRPTAPTIAESAIPALS
jgi:FHS family L-fucose permease-like MFS transporter